MAIRPATRTTLYQEVINQIIEIVKREEWTAGERIPGELELARMFVVSRNCIREALKALAHAGVLESKPGLGTFLSPEAMGNIHTMELGRFMRDDNSLRELMEVRIMLEPQVVQLVAERATDEEIESLCQTVEESSVAIRTNAYSLRVGLEFHMVLVRIAKNRILMRIFNSVADEMAIQRGMLMLSRPSERELLRELGEHEEICRFIKARQGSKAAGVMHRHLKRAMGIMDQAKINGEDQGKNS